MMLSPPVSALSCARNHRPFRSATRPRGLPALLISDKCQVTNDNLCVAACLRVVRACISSRILFCLANPLGSYLWKFSGLQNSINKCVVLDNHHCAFGSHWREATRLVFRRTVCPCLFSQHMFLQVSDVTESMVFGSFREGHKHLLLQGTSTQQSTKYPPRLVAFIAGLLVAP